MLVVKSGNDFLDDCHWLQRRTEEGEERKCRQNDRSEHRSINMPRTDQGRTNIRASVPENNWGVSNSDDRRVSSLTACQVHILGTHVEI